MNSIRSNNPSLKYQSFTPSGLKHIMNRKFEFMAKTHFLKSKEVSNAKLKRTNIDGAFRTLKL